MAAVRADAVDPPATPRDAAEPGQRRRVHRFLVPTLLVLATLLGFAGAFSVWVNRQALNTDNWASTSGKLLTSKQIEDALGAYLVNELYTNVDVAGALQQKLPDPAKPLAGPAAAGLKELATRAAPELLASPKVQDAWVRANKAAHTELLNIINGGGPVVSNESGVVTLDLHALVGQLATDLGLQSQLAAAQAKLQGATGAQVRALAQQKLGIALPPASGKLVIMRSDQLKAAQDVAGAVKSLALVLPVLAIASFGLAVWLARGRRRRVLRTSGWCFVLIGVLLLLVRRVAGNEIVDSLVKVPSNKPAVHEVWNIAASLLYGIAVALIVYGIVIILSAWLAGPTRPATFIRRSLAPWLRERPGIAYATVGGALLLLVVWGPAPAFRQIAWVALLATLLALGVTALRRQTALEFPDIQRGDALRQLRERRDARRARKAAAASLAAKEAAAAAAPAGSTSNRPTVDDLERLVSLHDNGDLTDTEFAAAKNSIVNPK